MRDPALLQNSASSPDASLLNRMGMGRSDDTLRYRIRNWPEYNLALVNRGRLTLWVDQDAIAAWRFTVGIGWPGPTEGLRRRGD